LIRFRLLNDILITVPLKLFYQQEEIMFRSILPDTVAFLFVLLCLNGCTLIGYKAGFDTDKEKAIYYPGCTDKLADHEPKNENLNGLLYISDRQGRKFYAHLFRLYLEKGLVPLASELTVQSPVGRETI
jgi:hypothetical protein